MLRIYPVTKNGEFLMTFDSLLRSGRINYQ